MNHPVYESITMLFQRAKKSLTTDELNSLSGLTDAAASESLRLARATESLACLIDHDSQSNTPAGTFQDGEAVFTLLCGLSHSLEVIGAMSEVGGQAAYEHQTRMIREATRNERPEMPAQDLETVMRRMAAAKIAAEEAAERDNAQSS